MSEKKWTGRLVPPWGRLVSCRVAGAIVALITTMTTTTTQAEYVTLWAMAEGGGITTLGDDGDDSDDEGPSPGDCTECEYWERSIRECLPLPEGREIDGEPCKECDEEGEPRDKEDGEDCTGSDGIVSRCCSGSCLGPLKGCCDGQEFSLFDEGCCAGEVYNTDEKECCGDVGAYDPQEQGCCTPEDGGDNEITDNAEDGGDPCRDNQNVPPRRGGTVMCYNGQPIVCVYSENFPPGLPDYAEECIEEHEQDHVDDPDRRPCTCAHRPARSSNRPASECRAYAAEVQCIDRHEPNQEENPEAWQRWKDYRDHARDRGNRFCRLANMTEIPDIEQQ